MSKIEDAMQAIRDAKDTACAKLTPDEYVEVMESLAAEFQDLANVAVDEIESDGE